MVLLCPLFTTAQDGQYDLGARNHALGGTSITLSDSWALFNNPGAAGNAEQTTLMTDYQNRFQLEGFQVVGGGAVYHHKLVNMGVKYFKFGDHYYNQQLMGLVLANHFQMVSLGAGIDVIQTHTEGVNTRRVWVGEFGGIARLTSHLVLGAHIFNFKNGKQYPTTMKAGLSYRPVESLMLNVEIRKQLQVKEQLALGLEYALIKRLLARTGITLQENLNTQATVQAAFGLGFHPGNFLIDYAFSSQPLGAIHEISLAYQISPKP